jgi:hypothetical protein
MTNPIPTGNRVLIKRPSEATEKAENSSIFVPKPDFKLNAEETYTKDQILNRMKSGHVFQDNPYGIIVALGWDVNSQFKIGQKVMYKTGLIEGKDVGGDPELVLINADYITAIIEE